MRFLSIFVASLVGLVAATALAGPAPGVHAPVDVTHLHRVNIIDGADDRDSLLVLGPSLGLSAGEIDRIRKVSGHVGCFEPTPNVASGALYLTNDQLLTAGHLFFEDDGTRRSKCFFRQQTPGSEWLALRPDLARFGAAPPRPGSNADWAVVRFAAPVAGVEPFPVDVSKPAVGDRLIVVTAHPAGMDHVDLNVPVVQGCSIRRAPVSSEATSFYRSDCDATGASSGGMHLARVDGALVFRGITITTGPWRDPALAGAAYDEAGGSVTTALGTDAAILAAGRDLAGAPR
jgi:hypothetical protein